jgi:tubulin polyglutamylase TTLL4
MEGVNNLNPKLPKLAKLVKSNKNVYEHKGKIYSNSNSNLTKSLSSLNAEKSALPNFKKVQVTQRNSLLINNKSVKNNVSIGKVRKSEIRNKLSDKISLDMEEIEEAKNTTELEDKFESDLLLLNQDQNEDKFTLVKFIEFYFNNEKEAFSKTIFISSHNSNHNNEKQNLFSKKSKNFFQKNFNMLEYTFTYAFIDPDPNHFLQNKIFYKSYKRAPACITTTLNFCSKTSSTKTTHLIWKLYKFEKMMKLIPSLSKHQKYNHFPKTFQLGRKDHLYKNFRKLQAKFPKDYTFMPITYIFPQDVQKFQSLKKLSSQSWIVKPVNSSRGRGIHLLTDLNEINSLAAKSQNKNCEYLISKYLDNPHLINNKKYDLRIYVLITSFTPLKIYIFEEGLVRFASENYTIESKENIYVHLTNYAINKKNKNYEKNDIDDTNDLFNNCSKWSLSQYRKYFKEKNLENEIEKIFSKIKDIVIKSILSSADESMQFIRGSIKYKNSLFELYGFDVLIDDRLNPWLLEVNVSPSLNCDSHLDLKIKSELIRDMLNIVGLSQDCCGGEKNEKSEMIPQIVNKESKDTNNSKFNLSKFKVKVCKDFKDNLNMYTQNNLSIPSEKNIFDFSIEEKQIFNEISNYPEYHEMIYNYISEVTRSHFGKFEMIFPNFDEIDKIKYYSQFLMNPGDDNILLWKWINHNYNNTQK